MMKRFFCLVFVFVSACTTYPCRVESVSVDFGYQLPLIQDNRWGSFSALQEITVKSEEGTWSFKVQLEVVDNQITVIGLTPVHSRSFLITLKDGMVNYEQHPFFKYPLAPEQFLVDIQLSFIDPVKWQTYLVGTGLQIQQRNLPEVREIILSSSSKKVITLLKYKDSTTLTHLDFGYEVQIRTLQLEAL